MVLSLINPPFLFFLVLEDAPTEEIIDVSTACRICLSDINSQVYVKVDDSIKSLNNTTYKKIFVDFSGFDVVSVEPQYFCSKCAKKLISVHELKILCNETQDTLDEWKKHEDEVIQEETLDDVVENFENDYIIEELEEEVDDEPIYETANIKYEEVNTFEEHPKMMQERYNCEKCNTFDLTKKGLRDHYRSHHPELKTEKCSYCKTKHFAFLIDEHMQNCKKASYSTVCPICGVIVDQKDISRHIETHKTKKQGNIEKPYQCDICSIRTVAKCGLVKHMQVQHLQHRLRCEVCYSEFKTPSVLIAHIRKYHPERKAPLKCKLCEFQTADASVLRRHTLYHMGEKHHKCKYAP